MTDIAAPRPYELFDREAAADPVEIPAGTSLLVTAPDSVGREFIEDQLGRAVRDGARALVITADDSAGTVADRVAAAAGIEDPTVSESLHVIDCQTEQISADTGDEIVTQDVETPRNLTDIGIGFKSAFDEFEAAGADRVRVGVLSLSIILSYIDRETAYRFSQTLTRAIEQNNAFGLFLLNTTAHDDETIQTLRRAFDGTVEIRTDDEDGRSVRIDGVDGVTADWRPVDE